ATGAQKPLVVAWSFGTLVAMDYLRESGVSALSGLVLTGAIGALKPFQLPPADDPLVAEFAKARKLQMSPDPRDQVTSSWRMVDWLTDSPLPANERSVLQSIAMMFPGYARRAIYSRPQDNQDLLPLLAGLPVRLALGSEDNALMVEDGVGLAEGHDTISLSMYEGAGHSVFLEDPDRFTAELRKFAVSLWPGAADTAEIAASAN
ncbi:MAG: alpha/beta hydrolase, partial [Chromatocurvus sp.]